MIQAGRLLATLHLETAASRWWDKLSRDEQDVYIKAHPKTRMRATKTRNVPRIATKEVHTGAIEAIKKHLAWIAHSFPDQPLAEPFVLQHGRPYIPDAETYAGKRQQMHMCFMNATRDALNNSDRTYVEGYITIHGVPIQHAWTVDSSGRIHDPTITPSEHVAGYFGVPFSTDYVLHCMEKNRVYGVLGHESRKTLEPLLRGDTKTFGPDQ